MSRRYDENTCNHLTLESLFYKILNLQKRCYPMTKLFKADLKLIYRRLFLIIVIICLALPSSSLALIGIKEGDAPAKISLSDLEGNSVELNDYFGKKPVIIVFWELAADKSFLNYSLDELIFLNSIHKKYKSEHGLEIFTVYTPEDADTVSAGEMSRVRNLLKINNIKLPVLIDRGLKTYRDYGVIALPSTVMVGKAGKIQFIYPSFPITARPVFADKIQQLLGLSSGISKHKKSKKGDVAQSVRLYQYALQMFKKGLLEQALSPLKKSIQLDQRAAGSHNLMGIILRQKGDFEGAISELQTSMNLDSSNVHPRFNYALLLLENEKYIEAETMLLKVLKLDNKLAEAHYALGILYKNIKRNEDAVRELRKAFELFEKSKPEQAYEINDSTVFNRISTLYILSEILQMQGNTKQSLKLLDKAAEIALGLDINKDKRNMHRSKELLIYE